MRKIRNYINQCKFRLKKKLGRILLSAISLEDISVDVHQRGGSWAVINLRGEKRNYLKFVDLDDASLKEIVSFLRQFEKVHPDNINIDAGPFDKGIIHEELLYNLSY